MKNILAISILATAALCGAQSWNTNGALAGPASTPSSGIVFSPTGGTTGTTRYVGLSYPTVPADTLFFTLGAICTPSSCPVTSSVISGASAVYKGPNCIPTSGCTAGSTGFGSPIKATVGTTINAQVYQAVSINQNNLSTTSLPANWFPSHWKYIPSNTSSTPVSRPTTGTGCGGSCVGNILTSSMICYIPTCGGVGTLATIVNAFVIPGATAPVTPPTDPLTGLPAVVTHIGFSSSSQKNNSSGDPQILYTESNESSQDCPSLGTAFCTWIVEDFWILGSSNPVAAWESDAQIFDSGGRWTFALQCRVHGPNSAAFGWEYSNQTNWPPTHIPNTTVSNCPSATQWLHVIYTGTRNQSAGTFTILTLTLQSAPGGPAGATGYATFPVNVTYFAASGSGNSCTNQMQIDAWCGTGSNCSSTQVADAYYALNNVSCGTGTPPVTSVATQVYN